MSENNKTSWQCGGCGVWYSIYAVSKCECQKIVQLQSGSTKGYGVLPPTDTRVYSSPAISGGVMMNDGVQSSCCVAGCNCKTEILNAMVEAIEAA